MLVRFWIVIMAGMVSACGPAQRSEWDTMDYSRIIRQNRGYENDNAYEQPSVLSCVDDDLYNCR